MEALEVVSAFLKVLAFPAAVLLRKASNSSSLVAQLLTKTGQVSHRAKRKINPNLPEELGEAEALNGGVEFLSQLATSGVLGGYIKYRNKLKEERLEMQVQKLENESLENRVQKLEKTLKTHSVLLTQLYLHQNSYLAEITKMQREFREEMKNFKKKSED